MNMKNIIWLSFLLLAFGGCYDDKGNYDYTESNGITIDLKSTMYTAVAGETINIEPTFTFALDSNENGLTYEWKLGNQFLSDKRNLSFYVDTIMKENCYLRVLDTKTGITYLAYTTFDLTEKHNTQGWMILSEKDGGSYLTYIREQSAGSSYNYVEYPGVYEEENHVKLGGKPVGLLEHFYYRTTSSNTWVLQEGGETVDLSGRSFKQEITLKESFLDEQLPANFSPLKMVEMRWISAVIDKNDHKVYTRKKIADNSYFTGSYLNNPLEYEGKVVYATNFVIAPFMSPGYTLMVEGEKGHQRYLALIDKDKSSAGKVLSFKINEGYKDGFSHLDDLGNMEIVYTGYSREVTGSILSIKYHSILKSSEGAYYYQDFVVTPLSNTNAIFATPGIQVKLDAGINIDEKTLFYVLPYPAASYMMIANGADLYMIKRANIGSENMASFVTLYKHFESNITAMNAEDYNSYRLGVGLENGKFYVLNMNEGILDETKRVLYEAKANVGKVVDIRYKVQRVNNWSN